MLCLTQTAATTLKGSIQCPVPDGSGSLSTHKIVYEEVSMTCCSEKKVDGCSVSYPSCCRSYCHCQDITTPQKFGQCLVGEDF